MRKVWQTKRNGLPGVYVEWYDENNRRRSKYFGQAFRKYAKEFQARKFAELNSGVLPAGDVVSVPWQGMVEQYIADKDAEGLRAASLVEIRHTLKIFADLTGITASGQMNTRMMQTFLKCRREGISPNTLNKDIRNLRTLIAWGQRRRYIGGVEAKRVKAEGKRVRVLRSDEITTLLRACGDDQQWRMRILLAVCTGFRKSTLDRLHTSDFDLQRRAVSMVDRKTGKATSYQPLPDAIVPEIERFMRTQIAQGQVLFFKFRWSKKWYDILKDAKLSERTEFHDLRRTFGSMQADAGTPIKALQEMYNHANIETTMRHYIATSDTVKRASVNKLGENINSWLGT